MIKACALLLCGLATALQAQPLRSPDETYAAVVAGRYDDVEAYYAKLQKERPRNDKGEFLLDGMIWATPVFSSDDPKANDYWPKTDAITARWLAHSPRSVLASITRARALVRRAEHIQATNGPWKDIDKLVAEARRVMDASRARGARDPAWHAMRLRLAKMEGLPHEQIVAMVKTATAVEPRPLLVWQEAAFALREEDRRGTNLVWLMRYAVDQTRASEGTTMYVRVLMSAFWAYPEFAASPFSTGLDWKLLNSSITEQRKRYPGAYDPNLHGALACLAGDRQVTAEAIRDVGTQPFMPTWETWGGKPHWERCKEWAFHLRAGTGT
jgi:hypothetical protein